MKSLPLVLLATFMTTWAQAQSVNESQGDKVANIQIIASKEFFKLPDGTHKDLIGATLEGFAFQSNEKSGNAIQKIIVAPFEIHVQGTDLGGISVADVKAAAVKFLFETNVDGGVGFSGRLNMIDFDYKNFGLNDPEGRNFRYNQVSFAKLQPGIRFSDKKGSYIVLGGVAGMSIATVPGGSLYRNTVLEDYESEEIFEKEDSNSGVQTYVGFYGDVNLKDKLRITGSVNWGNNNFEESWKYNTKEQVEVSVPVELSPFEGESFLNGKSGKGQLFDENPITKTVEKTKTNQRKFEFYTERFNMNVKIESDLGKLISPALTGLSLRAGVDVNGMTFSTRRYQSSSTIEGEEAVPNQVNLSSAPDQTFNQVQFNVGLKINVSEINNRAKAAKKYRGMADMF